MKTETRVGRKGERGQRQRNRLIEGLNKRGEGCEREERNGTRVCTKDKLKSRGKWRKSDLLRYRRGSASAPVKEQLTMAFADLRKQSIHDLASPKRKEQ